MKTEKTIHLVEMGKSPVEMTVSTVAELEAEAKGHMDTAALVKEGEHNYANGLYAKGAEYVFYGGDFLRAAGLPTDEEHPTLRKWAKKNLT